MQNNSNFEHNPARDSFDNEIFKIKEIIFKDENRNICMQSQNGPCPLIAILNILLLRGDVKLENQSSEFITGKEMVNIVGEHLLVQAPPENRNVDRVLRGFSQLKSGLTVNVKFSSVSDFEEVVEESSEDGSLLIFRWLRICLLHGWLPEPEKTPQLDRVQSFSYEAAAAAVLADDIDEGDKALLPETKSYLSEFLGAPGRLTYSGLIGLYATVTEDQLAVLFHDGHFSVVYRQTGESSLLFLLATDIGFSADCVGGGDGGDGPVWITLNSVSGDTQFADHNFRPVPGSDQPPASSSDLTSDEAGLDAQLARQLLIEDDYAIAMALHQQMEADEAAQHQSEQHEHQSASLPRPDSQPPVRTQQRGSPTVADQARRQEGSCIIL